MNFILLLMLSIFSTLFGPKGGNMNHYTVAAKENTGKSIHAFTVNDIDGKPVSMSKYQGKVLVIVNVASKCGNTPQYKDLEAFYEANKKKGIEILGFPANNFLGQEPGSNSEIKEFCSSKYGVTFPMFSKISVKGKDMDPLYKFLTSKSENGVMDSEVKWNFQKYLVDKNGVVVTFFDPKTSINAPEVIEAIDKLLH